MCTIYNEIYIYTQRLIITKHHTAFCKQLMMEERGEHHVQLNWERLQNAEVIATGRRSSNMKDWKKYLSGEHKNLMSLTNGT